MNQIRMAMKELPDTPEAIEGLAQAVVATADDAQWFRLVHFAKGLWQALKVEAQEQTARERDPKMQARADECGLDLYKLETFAAAMGAAGFAIIDWKLYRRGQVPNPHPFDAVIFLGVSLGGDRAQMLVRKAEDFRKDVIV